MSVSIGIVGLPNVGKSTLFKLITKKEVDCSNYPFCTIEPNVGVVAVPDERIDLLYDLIKSKKKVYATLEFHDIAGLVKGAHKGEGLGNQFLAHIREVDAILFVLRNFKDENIVNVQEKIDPIEAKEILETELILKDLETIEKRLNALEKAKRNGNKEVLKEIEVLEKAKEVLLNADSRRYNTQIHADGDCKFDNANNISVDSRQNPRLSAFTEEELKILKQYQLLTLKPSIYLLNGKPEEIEQKVLDYFKDKNFMIMDVKTELELCDLNKEERKELGFSEESGFDKLVEKVYQILNVITFFTLNQNETHAWTIEQETKVIDAAEKIHSDFKKHFIKAEVINWKDLVDAGGFLRAREKGLIKIEGKDYIVQDGDVIEIKHSA